MSERKELGIVRALLDAMNESIIYCHWKSNQHFSDALTGIDDLDILIDRNQYETLIKILAALDFKRFYTPMARTYIGIEDYLGFDSETGNIVHLHLHYQLVVGEKHLKGFHLPLEKQVLDNRVWNEEYKAFLSCDFDELLLLIVRLAMKNRWRDVLKKRVTEKNTLTEYTWLKQQCPDFSEKLKTQGWLSDRLKKCVEDCYRNGFQWGYLYNFKKNIYKDLACYSIYGRVGNSCVRHSHEIKRIVLEIKKRYLNTKYSFLRRRPATGGVLIAFLGSDGAGKSSAIAEMNRWLKKVMDVRYFYLGSGDGNSSFLRKPLKIAKMIAQKMGIISVTNNFNDSSLKENINSNKQLGKARELWTYTLSKERIKKLTQANRCRMRGFVVLTDRYPQNEFDGLCDGPKLRGRKGFAAKKETEAYRIAELCPPDVAIKLIVSPEEAMKRKPGEIQLETSKSLTDRVRAIHFSDRTEIVEINADQEQSKVWLEIKRAIWKAL